MTSTCKFEDGMERSDSKKRLLVPKHDTPDQKPSCGPYAGTNIGMLARFAGLAAVESSSTMLSMTCAKAHAAAERRVHASDLPTGFKVLDWRGVSCTVSDDCVSACEPYVSHTTSGKIYMALVHSKLSPT